MRRLSAMLVLAACSVAPAAGTQPTVHARVVATDPASASSTLGRRQSFYVCIEYSSDQPVSLWARPYFHGKEAPAMSNPSRQYVGTGYALGWFAFREPANVDEVRIIAGGGKPYREWIVDNYPVQLHWTSATAAPHRAAPWVAELQAADRAAEKQAMQAAMREPITSGDQALLSGIMLVVFGSVLGGLAAPVWAFRKWRSSALTWSLHPIRVWIVQLLLLYRLYHLALAEQSR